MVPPVRAAGVAEGEHLELVLLMIAARRGVIMMLITIDIAKRMKMMALTRPMLLKALKAQAPAGAAQSRPLAVAMATCSAMRPHPCCRHCLGPLMWMQR